MKARSFGVAYNGITASAAIPEFIYRGPGTPIFLVGYDIPSAASYDWVWHVNVGDWRVT
ncbi:MAG: hypothetical protein ACLP70_21620 [Streptosporangiaceae bacterium]